MIELTLIEAGIEFSEVVVPEGPCGFCNPVSEARAA